MSAKVIEQVIEGTRVRLMEDGRNSSIELPLPNGPIETIWVPAIDGRGNPSMEGREPTMGDLRDLAQLRVEFQPILLRLFAGGGEPSLLSIAKRTGLAAPTTNGTFEWLRILRAARLTGKLDG